MSITYPPEMLPVPESGDEVEIVLVADPVALTAEELIRGLAIRAGTYDGTLHFRTITPEEFYAEFPPRTEG